MPESFMTASVICWSRKLFNVWLVAEDQVKASEVPIALGAAVLNVIKKRKASDMSATSNSNAMLVAPNDEEADSSNAGPSRIF